MQARGVTEKAYVEQCKAGRHHAERGCSRTKTNGRGSAASARAAGTDSHASGASSRAAKTSSHDNCGTRAASGPSSNRLPQETRNAGGGAVCGRSFGKSPLPGRHRRLGQLAVEGLSLRRNEELRHHKARRLHVREGSNCC